YIFAALALTIGAATLLNGTLVVRFGMLRIVTLALGAFVLISLLYIILFASSGNPSFPVALSFFALQFFAVGFLFGNLRALAMEPVGHIAGIGAAISGFIATIMGVPISAFIGSYVSHSILPMFIGFLVCGLISVIILSYYHKGKGIQSRVK
ncbi:MAG: Bcr/CflA family drug resistance efflux transporter, partial [Flavobacteriaceae bacterium]